MPFRLSEFKKQLPSLRGKIIFSTVTTAVVSLALCVAALLLLISNILGAYVQNEVDFAMREVNSGLNTKTVYLEDILLSIREDELLTRAMRGGGLDAGEDSDTARELNRVADLYSDKNTAKLTVPFLDMVYLFDNRGAANRSSYYDYLSSAQAELDRRYTELFRAFSASGRDFSVSYRGGHVNVCFVVFDDRMRPMGTAIFAVNGEAVGQLMRKIDQYQNSFWFLSDGAGVPVLASEGFSLPPESVAELAAAEAEEPYNYCSATAEYRVCRERMSMDLSAAIGVDGRQLNFLLYDTVKYYLCVPALLLALLAVLLFIRMVRLTRPLPQVASSLQKVAERNFDVKLPRYDSRELDTISQTFNSMTDTINYLVNDVYEKKLLVMESEQRFLQSQMNPHFMYNVLNTIALKASLNGDAEIGRMASNLSSLLQAHLSHNGDEKITVEQELQLVRFYLELQKSRFEDKLSYHIAVQDVALLRCLIPKLTMEFIVENAVIHGIEPKTGPGAVYVDVAREGDDLVIRIEDDGVGFEGQAGTVALPLPDAGRRSPGHNRVALNNAVKIIHLFYGEQYGITIQSRQGAGTMVTIRIPLDNGGV